MLATIRPGLVRQLLALLALVGICASSPALAQSQPTPDEALQTLATGTLQERMRAVAAFAETDNSIVGGNTGGSGAAASADEIEKVLLAATGDPSPEVRQLAWSGLLSRPAERSTAERGLEDPEPVVKTTVIAGLAPLPKSVTPESNEAQWRAELLVEAMGSAKSEHRLTAIEALVRMPRSLLPSCTDTVEEWRQADELELGFASQLELEGRAWLINQVLQSASACGMSAEEFSVLQEQSERYRTYLDNPELNLAKRRYGVRLARAKEKLETLQKPGNLEHANMCQQRVETNWGLFEDLYARAEELGRMSVGGDEAAQNRALEAFRRVEGYVDELEACYREASPFGVFGVLDPVRYWAQAGFETWYDDHFLARREDVERLRVTDQLSQRFFAQFEASTKPHYLGGVLPYDLGEDFHRFRAEASGDFFYGESQLNGPGGWLDWYGHYGWSADDWLAWMTQLDWDQGMTDRYWPHRLVAPGGSLRSLVLYREGMPGKYHMPDWAVGIGVKSDFYAEADPISPSRQAVPNTVGPGAPQATFLAPEEISRANRLGGELRVWGAFGDQEFGVYLDGETTIWGYPEGMPTRVENQGIVEESTRDGIAVIGRVEPGVYWAEDEFLIFAQLGATMAHFPEPTSSPIARFTGRIHAQLAEPSRASEGGQMYLDLLGQYFDGPGVEDGQYGLKLEGGLLAWVPESDFFFEFDMPVFLEFYGRDLAYDAGNTTVLTAGAGVYGHFSIDRAYTISVGYRFVGELDELRHELFAFNINQDTKASIVRNMVVLSLRASWNGPNLAFEDARAPEWGTSPVGDPLIPPHWWQ